MKIIIFVVCSVIYAAAEPSCPPAGETYTAVYFPHPSDCSKFLTCHHGNLVELSCPTGTFWNDNAKACDFQANVVCSSYPETTTEPATTTTEFQTTTSTAPTSDFQTTTSATSAPATSPAPTEKCPENYDPDHQVYLPHEDCTKYYICTWGGAAVEQNCPPNLHWNQYLSYCDYPQQAGCASSSQPTSTSSPVSTTTLESHSTSVAYATDSCPEVYDPNHQVYFPHLDCTKYYICTYEGNKLEQDCPAGLHWSQTDSYCDRPELVLCAPLKQANECPEGYDPEHPSFFPHEQDCDRYYVCYDGHLIEHQCADELHWNQDAEKCSAPEEAECFVGTTVTPTDPECPEVEEEEDQPAFFPHQDCSRYYVCSNGYPYEMSCADGTYWNEQESVCDAPENSDCVPQQSLRSLIRV